MDGTVLVADDDRTIRTVLTQALTRAGCKVQATSSLTTLMRWVGEGLGDVVITDVMMPDGNGLEMLPKIAADRPDLPVIVISAQNTIMTTIKAAEAEAFDYLPKPFDLPDLMKRTAKALEVSRKRGGGRAMNVSPEPNELPLVGRSVPMQEVYKLVARVLNANLPVIVTGESGAGKSLVARVIHDMSDRRTQPFVVLTESAFGKSGALADVLAEAGQGTVLFEEISDLPDAYQMKAVHLMDAAGRNGPRFLATSQMELSQAMAQGKLVAASDVGGHRELIRDGETGTLFPPDDPAGIAAALTGLFANRRLWDARRTRARAFVEAERNWSSNILRYEPVYQRLLDAVSTGR